MIITLMGANFTNCNIGTLTTWNIRRSLGSGATSSSSATTVDRDASWTETITLADGYTFGTYSITMGSTAITPTVTDNTLTFTISAVTGNINITVATINESTGEEDGGDTGGETSVDLTSQFTFEPGVLGYEWGWASIAAGSSECPSPATYPGYNPILTRSNFVNVDGYTSLKIVNITRKGGIGGTTGGYAFYTTNSISETVTAKAAINYTANPPTVQPASFIAEGSENRHHVNYGVEGVIEETIQIPAGAKYIRITGWADSSYYATTPFSCIAYK